MTNTNQMMTTAAAKKFVNHDHYVAYQALGGRLSENKYRYVASQFVRHTMDIFVGGDCTFYDSRQAAAAGFQKWATGQGYHDSPSRIFKSIDQVTPYT